MSLDPNTEKSADMGADNGKMNGISGINAMALNAFLVIIAVLVFQFFFRLVNNTMDTFGSFFTGRNILIWVGYALIFAILYGKFACHCCSPKKKARIPIVGNGSGEGRSFISRLLNALLFALLACALYWFSLELVRATGFADADGDGVKDSEDVLAATLLFVAYAVLKGGGAEEGGDDATDPGGRTGISSGGR